MFLIKMQNNLINKGMTHFTWKYICLEYMTSKFLLVYIYIYIYITNNTLYELFSNITAGF